MSNLKAPQNLCLGQTDKSVTSISTTYFVPQPLPHKSHYVQNRLFVGGLPKSASKREIAMLMRQFGEITETNLIDDGCRRFAFVTFENIDSADAVLSLYHRGRPFLIKGCPVAINRAYFKPKKVDGSKGKYSSMESDDTNHAFGVYHNGTVYFDHNSPMQYMPAYSPNNYVNNPYYEPQQNYYYGENAPLVKCPMYQQTYKTEYNINQNVNISQVVNSVFNHSFDNSDFSSSNEQNSQDGLVTGNDLDNSNAGNRVIYEQGIQPASPHNALISPITGYWCTDAKCMQKIPE
uniref:Protein boule-like n=1 Tax=Phallusia mammillata TaxID=59560 RepID=A0A6F9D700_9ASCI|nr:protein boule-like [Phallusia mammillata]